MFRQLGLGLVLGMAAWGAMAQSAQVALSNDSAHFRYGMLVGGQSFGRSEVAVGAFFNKDDNVLGDFGLFIVDEAGSKVPGLEAGVGGKLVTARSKTPDRNFFVGALGLSLRYAIPGVTRLAIGGDAFYAPSIVSGLDADNYIEYSGRVEYEILPQAGIFVGYRYMGGDDTHKVRIDINKSVHLGLRVTF
ncbi:MAG: YfaZ family protein [Gammaproteobacteria bacterium]|nr:YfaZ family protein [Gammaproteobacteria bacterium]